MVTDIKKFKKLVGRIAGVICVAGLMTFTFVGCGKQEQAPAPQETVAVESVDTEYANTSTTQGFLDYSEADEAEPEQIVEEYTITFEDSANEEMVAKSDENVTIPTYLAENYFDYLKGTMQADITIKDDGAYYGDYFMSAVVEKQEDETVKVVNVIYDNEYNAIVNYVVSGDEIQPKNIRMVKTDGPVESGITYILDKDNQLIGIEDLFGNDISNLKINRGKCIGWSTTPNSTEAEYKFDEKTLAKGNLTLYPVFESKLNNRTAEGLEIDSDGSAIEIIIKDGKIVYVGSKGLTVDKDGKLVASDKEDKDSKNKDSKDKDSKDSKSKDSKNKDGKDKTSDSKKKTDNNKKQEQPKQEQPKQEQPKPETPQIQQPEQAPSNNQMAAIFGDLYSGETDFNAGVGFGFSDVGMLE